MTASALIDPLVDASRVAAFFDMDKTVVLANTGSLYARDMRQRGEISFGDTLKVASILLRYKLTLVDMNRVMTEAARSVTGTFESALTERCDALFEREVAPRVSKDARDAIEAHRTLGHRLVLLTASTPYMSRPLCRHLAIEDYLCSHLEIRDGRFTGDCVQPICYGSGKVHWASEWARARGVDLSQSYFYTDSYSDLPMLDAVGMPRVVNPDPRLRFAAFRRKWPVLNFR